MSDGPPYAENDPRHWTFRAGVSKPKPACPTCGRAMFFGLAGNWWCRPCKAGEPPLPKRPAPGETPRNAPEDRPMTDWPRGEQPGPGFPGVLGPMTLHATYRGHGADDNFTGLGPNRTRLSLVVGM